MFALAIAATAGITRAKAQESEPPKPPDTFFAGTVEATTPQKIVVSRIVLGKAEKREFRVTPKTRIEGRLRVRVRVTVSYVSDDDGDVAVRIVVRPDTTKKK